jgi:hypothetical protein
MAQDDYQCGQFAGIISEKDKSFISRVSSKRYTNDAENVTISSNDEPQLFDKSPDVGVYKIIL